mgnify:CR=1 FL=1
MLAAAAAILLSGSGPVTGQQQGATNLGPVVNAADSDFGPIVTADGNALYFTSDRQGGFGGQDIWVSRRVGGQWTQPVNLGDQVNTKYNEGPDSFSVDERVMFFTRCDREQDPGACDIYTAAWDEGKKAWGNVKNLGPNVNSRYNDANSSLSYDGKTLYFVSMRPTEDKKSASWDIFMSRKQGDGWGPAERLGAPINTAGNEFHVMIHQDGVTMYFSSDGLGGFGGADIFFTRMEAGVWTAPQNLGPMINTPENDMYFTIAAAGDLAYLASNRSGTIGQEDIYSVPVDLFSKPKDVIIVKGIVADRSTCAPPAADPATGIPVYDIRTCAPIDKSIIRLADFMSDQVITEKITGPTGFYQVVIPAGKDYSVTATARGYSFHSERFNVSKTQPYQVIEKNILLDPARVGMAFPVNNIFFDFDRATLRPESKNELNNAIRFLNDNPTIRIEIGGHTDSKGSDAYNLKLSQARAKSVYDYLTQNGIDPNRLQAFGYGERMPIATNATDEGRQLNRRIEFKVIK